MKRSYTQTDTTIRDVTLRYPRSSAVHCRLFVYGVRKLFKKDDRQKFTICLESGDQTAQMTRTSDFIFPELVKLYHGKSVAGAVRQR